MLSLVSTWMGDRLGTLGAVGSNFSFLLFLFLFLCVCLQLYRSSESSESLTFVKVVRVVKVINFIKVWHDVRRPLRLFHIHHCAVECSERSSMFRKKWILWTASRSGCGTLSHHRGLKDFEFQTGNSLITLQKWSCEVWSWRKVEFWVEF